MTRRAQADMLSFVFSVLMFVVFFFIALIVINIPGISKGDVERAITSDSRLNEELVAGEQLSGYLQAEMPDDFSKIIEDAQNAWYAEVNNPQALYQSGNLFRVNFCFSKGMNDPLSFLSENKNLYIGRTYGEFIEELAQLKDDKKACAFDFVTKAMFMEKGTTRFGDNWHSPNIVVKYNFNGALEVKTDNKGISLDFFTNKNDYLSSLGDSALAYSDTVVAPVQVLPARDGTLIAVQLIKFRGNDDFRQPEP